MTDIKYGPWHRLSPEERYYHDPVFRALVDHLEHMMEEDQGRLWTSTELREACMFAAMRYEARHIKAIVRTIPATPEDLR